MEWKNLYRGFLMGTSDLIPGVSAGTIAVILGIYNRLIQAINSFFSKDWKKQLGFLIPLGVGVLSAIFLLSHLIDVLLEEYPQPTNFFFLGLIIGILPFLYIKADIKNTFTSKHYILLVIAFLAIASLSLFNQKTVVLETIGATQLLVLFFSGFLASMAMVLPGVSGSFVLLLIGMYELILHEVSEFNFIVIGAVGAGVLSGIVLMSRLLKYLLTSYPIMMYAAIIGMVAGSTFVIYPGIDGQIIISIVTLTVGFATAVILGRIENKK
ncbi:DUF368 domain-containing protein [Bacillus sp. SCS-151]|uniref:DUF368 domain-containing protein n=1 Tax=Nanhaiella sioensis TaxID=3115293 RepID=UPI00397BCA0D